MSSQLVNPQRDGGTKTLKPISVSTNRNDKTPIELFRHWLLENADFWRRLTRP
jgi:hypothetical protein